ncbi:TonB-dependent siderophore receptor [Chryseobacterium sp. A301]
MRKLILPAFLLLATQWHAQNVDTTQVQDITEVIINQTKTYKNENAFAVSKLNLKDIENPQVYISIPKVILRDQVATNFKSVLSNATGITRLWESTSRGGDGAEYYTMRGFSTQSRLVNGMASFNNGGLDPQNIENIDVIKGPSGTLYGGSLVSYGGLINIQTKKPEDHFKGNINYITGTNALHRVTADVNTPISHGLFLRVNTAYHQENSFQDAGFTRSFFIAPSLKYKANERLTFLVNTEFKSNKGANAPMIFLNRNAPLSFHSMDLFEKNYKKSYTSNNLTTENPSFNIQSQMIYKLSPSWTSQTLVSSSSSKALGYYHYLWDSSNGDEFSRLVSKANSETLATGIQQNFIGDFSIGTMRNRLVVGLDYLGTNVINNDSEWVGYGTISLKNQTDTGILTTQGADQALANAKVVPAQAKTNIKSLYFSNVLNLTPKLSAMVSLRVDNFSGKPTQWSEDKIENQTSFSPKLGVVYQPILGSLSLFANYMNGFQYLAPVKVTAAGGGTPTLKIFDPERANQWEVGAKANLVKNKLSLTLSYYHINVSNKIMTDPENINNSIQGGEVLSEGFELSAVGNPIEGLSFIAGLSKNYATQLSGDPSYDNQRPEEAGPKILANLWAHYKIPSGTLQNLSFGAGLNYASEQHTLNRTTTGRFTLPSYTVLNAMVGYFPNRYSIALKLDNLTNKHYYSGWSTVSPQKLRTLSLSLGFNF